MFHVPILTRLMVRPLEMVLCELLRLCHEHVSISRDCSGDFVVRGLDGVEACVGVGGDSGHDGYCDCVLQGERWALHDNDRLPLAYEPA